MKPEPIDVVRFLKNSIANQDKYINKLDWTFSTVVIDNEYAQEHAEQVGYLISALFRDNLEDVLWFLYEFEAGSAGPHLVLQDGTQYTFTTNEDYYEYLKLL